MVASDPSASVVLPTYNRAESLPRAIQSVLDQTYTDFELLVVDDASTDETEDVVREFDDQRVEYVPHDVNRGASAARNTGIERATGDIVAFQDSDDEWFPRKLQRQMEVFSEVPADVGVVYTGMWRHVDGKRRYLPYSGIEPKSGDVGESIVRTNFVSTQMAAVRRECFEEVGGFDEELPALVDWELWLRISKQYRFEFVDEPLVEAEVRADSISENREQIVQARERIMNKHAEQFDSDSRANHLFFIGHGAMRSDQPVKGRTYLKKAALNGHSPAYLIAWFLAQFGPGIYNSAYAVRTRVRNRLERLPRLGGTSTLE